MNIKGYFDNELKSTLLYAVFGIVVGYVSFVINNSIAAFVIMIIGAVVFRYILQAVLKAKQDIKWWLGNGMIAYIIIWLLSWTIFYNFVLR